MFEIFWIKKSLTWLVTPFHFTLVLLILAGLLRLLGKRRTAFATAGLGLVILVVAALPFTAEMLARPLEEAYPPVTVDELPSDLNAIIVLGAGAAAAPGWPASDRLGQASLKRTLAGRRIWLAQPKAKLIFTSGPWAAGQPAPAATMTELAVELNVPTDNIITESSSRDTYENAKETELILKTIGTGPCALVTSARHMRRAMAVFRALGLHPIPVPCDYRPAPESPGWLPSLGDLASTQESLYEYLGYWWYWLRDRL